MHLVASPMPSPVTRYACDLCGREHESMTAAVLCEEQGPVPAYPVGLIFADHRPTLPDGSPNLRDDRTFAVATDAAYGHANYFPVYIADDDPAGDVLPPRRCGHVHQGRLTAAETHLDPARPAVARLAAALRAAGVDPAVWTAAGPVPFDTWARG